jgi:hypothetical protein
MDLGFRKKFSDMFGQIFGKWSAYDPRKKIQT